MKNIISPRQSNERDDQASKLGLFPQSEASLIAEWQDRGLETLSGHTLLKLRLTFASRQAVIAASAAG